MLLSEVLNTGTNWMYSEHQSSPSLAQYYFTVGGEKTYDVVFDKQQPTKSLPFLTHNSWWVEFSLMNSPNKNGYEITQTGDQYAVLSNVREICQDFIQRYNADMLLCISAQDSRTKLYERLFPRFGTIVDRPEIDKINQRTVDGKLIVVKV